MIKPLRRCRALIACLLLLPGPLFGLPLVPDGYSVELYAQGLGAVTGMTLDDQGDLYAADYDGGRILRIGGPGAVQEHATGIDKPTDLAFGFGGRLFAASSTNSRGDVFEVSSDGTASLFASGFSYPTSIAIWGDGMFVANSGDGTISRLDDTGASSLFLAGLSAPNGPYGISFSASGEMHFLDHGSGIVYAADSTGALTPLGQATGLGSTFTGIGFGERLFVSDVNLGSLMVLNDQDVFEMFATGFTGKLDPPFIGPNDFVFDGVGSIYVGDGGNIWRISVDSVPEPASLLLFTLGVVILGATRSRSDRQGVLCALNAKRVGHISTTWLSEQRK